MFKKISLITMGAAFLLGSAMPAFSAESMVLKRIKERGSINMGHRESSVPFSYIGKDGKPQGYSVDLCMKFIDAVKAEIEMPNRFHVPAGEAVLSVDGREVPVLLQQ